MKDMKLYNLIFPLWMALFFTPLILVVLIGNLIIDGAIIYIFFKLFQIKMERGKLRLFIFSAWGLGFLADCIGVGFLFALSGMNGIDTYHIWTNTSSIILFSVAVLISAICIFFFNYRLARQYGIIRKLAIQYALTMAILTAPYTFLIPTPWT